MGTDFERMTLPELQDLARRWGMKGVSRLRKTELLNHLRRLERQRRLADAQGLADPGAAFREWVKVQPWGRWLSLGLRLVGSAGIGLSVIMMIATPILTARAIPVAESGLHAGAKSLAALSDTLGLAQQALGSAAEVLRGTSQALSSMERSIANTQPLIESVAGLVGDTVPLTIEGTQRTLETAVQGAHAIDQVLRGLAALSAFTGVRYDPEHSLEQSLSSAAAGLQPIPEALRDIQGDLDNVGGELDAMRGRMRSTASDLDQFSVDLRQVEQDLGDRSADLLKMADGLQRAADSAKIWMWAVALVGELVLIGVAATQLMVYRAGREFSAASSQHGA